MALDLSVNIEGTNRAGSIELGTLNIEEVLNNEVDIARFDILYYGDKTYRPTANDEVVMQDGATKIFGGHIREISTEVEGKALRYRCLATDYGSDFNSRIVLERFENKTVTYIVTFILQKYAPGFTYANVDCDVTLDSMTFNRVTLTDALEKLARITNYSWYVDFDKDVHFFAKSDTSAPFDLTDTSENYIYESLRLREDITQLRNRITVRGGEQVGNTVTQERIGSDGRVNDNGDTLFDLDYKFNEKPSVTVASSPVTVGVEYLDNEDNFDAFWSYQEKYLRFKSSTAPGSSDAVDITGDPLYPIVVVKSDGSSIVQYGLHEHAITDKTLKSRDAALARAQGELDSYADTLLEGQFSTYESGLRVGQTINVNSALRGVNEDYLIKKVEFEQLSKTVGVWHVELITLRTFNIINVLQRLLVEEELGEISQEGLLTYAQITDTATVTDTISGPTTTTGPYYIEQDDPGSDSYDPPAVVNKSTVGADA